MRPSSSRPRVVVVVGNSITNDSRVQKSALAAARSGWEVVLLGLASSRRREESWMGPIRVVRVPLRRVMHDRWERMQQQVVSEASSSVPPSTGRWAQARLRFGRVPRRSTKAPRPATGAASGPRVPALPRVAPDKVEWRRDWPVLTDWALTFSPEIEALTPDLIHANDVNMLAPASWAAARLRVQGHTCAWIYDAHEYVPAVDWGGEAVSAAYRRYEREFIPRPDAIVTVSDEIAGLLQREYALADRPRVVRNVPIRFPGAVGDVSVRRAAGVSPHVPLLVYSGYLEPARGVGTMVEALPLLPEVHLVLVSSGRGRLLDELLGQARRTGVEARVHVAGYVPQHAVPQYLASADIGLIGSLHLPGFEQSLPTKTAEYLHARLPLVVSDVKTLSSFVRDHDVGRVFVAGEARSLAGAVHDALASAERIRSNITESLLDELSWERQSVVLMTAYHDVTGIIPEPPPTVTPWTVQETTHRPVSEAVQ